MQFIYLHLPDYNRDIQGRLTTGLKSFSLLAPTKPLKGSAKIALTSFSPKFRGKTFNFRDLLN